VARLDEICEVDARDFDAPRLELLRHMRCELALDVVTSLGQVRQLRFVSSPARKPSVRLVTLRSIFETFDQSFFGLHVR
jgi:hypothetical protein